MGASDRGLLRAFEKATESNVSVLLNLKHPKPGSRHIFLESNGKQSWRFIEPEASETWVKTHFLESNGKQSWRFIEPEASETWVKTHFLESNGKQSWRFIEPEASETWVKTHFLESNGKQS